MVNKTTLIIILLIVVAVISGLAFFTNPSPTGNVVNTSSGSVAEGESFFLFEGFALGGAKSHTGTFNDYDVSLTSNDGEITGFEGTIQASSVSTGIAGLDSHLMAEDFFAVSEHPEISFSSTSLVDGVLTGELTFLGVTQEISFPVETSESSISASFDLDVEPFGMKNTGVSEIIKIEFSFSE